MRRLKSLTAHRAFILECARLNPSPEGIARRAAAVEDWETAVKDAERYHLAGLVARAVEHCSAVPDGVKDRLRRARQRTCAMNGMYLRDASAALVMLQDAGLEPIVLKGVALAEPLYEDISLRPFCDLDVLLEVDQLATAERVLREAGYAQERSPHSRDWYFRHYYQLPRFVNPSTRFCIELHWDLGRRPYPFAFDLREMRARAVPVVISGVRSRSLDPADMLLHLAVHLAWGNGFDGHLRGLVDIAEIARRGVDWTTFEDRVIKGNAAQVTVPSLELASWLFDAPIPARVLRTLQYHRGGKLSRWVTRVGQSRVLEGGAGHRTWMRLLWLEHFSDRFTLLKQNFGEAENASLDTRPALPARLWQGAVRAAQPFLPHGSP